MASFNPQAEPNRIIQIAAQSQPDRERWRERWREGGKEGRAECKSAAVNPPALSQKQERL